MLAAHHFALGKRPHAKRDLVDIWCRSYTRPPASVLLDLDDTLDVAPSKTPSGKEVRAWLRRLIKRIRRRWPLRPEEAMTWCEANGIDYIFGVAGNAVLDRLVEAEADDIRVRRAEGRHAVMRGSGTIPAIS